MTEDKNKKAAVQSSHKNINFFKRFSNLVIENWVLILPAFIALILYLPAIRFDLVWDDTVFLRDLPNYRDPELWFPSLFRPFVLSPNYFRPMALLTFVVELLMGGKTWHFHLTNIALHAANTLIVTVLAVKLMPSSSNRSPSDVLRFAPAVIVGALYGLHPVLIEGVAFISSRFDLLMTVFLLLALLADLALKGRPNRSLVVGLCFLLAALSKEMAIAFAFALPFWHLALMKPKRSILKLVRDDRNWEVYLAVIISGVTYLGIRYASLGYLIRFGHEGAIPTGNTVQNILLVGKSLATYIVLVAWPFTRVSPIHFSELPVPTNQPLGWISLITAVLFLIGLIALIRKQPFTGWLSMAAAVSLLPVINIFPLELGGGSFIAERYLVFPLALVALATATILSRIFMNDADGSQVLHRISRTALGIWLLASVVTIQFTLSNWRDDLSLWEWAAQRAPLSSTPFTNLSFQYVNMGQYQVAGQLAEHAIDLSPENADAWNNLGLSYFHLEDYIEAEQAFRAAAELQTDNALFWNNIAGALREQGMLAEAEEILVGKVLKLYPILPQAHLNLGKVYLRADRPDLALGYLQQAMHLFPPEQVDQVQGILDLTQDPERWLKLGQMMLINDDEDLALDAFTMARELGASPADIAIGLSAAFIDLGRLIEAGEILSDALQVSPDDARLYNKLGIIARERGDLEEARSYFERAVELAPDWELPKENLQELQG